MLLPMEALIAITGPQAIAEKVLVIGQAQCFTPAVMAIGRGVPVQRQVRHAFFMRDNEGVWNLSI
jgi:hypothetical protein